MTKRRGRVLICAGDSLTGSTRDILAVPEPGHRAAQVVLFPILGVARISPIGSERRPLTHTSLINHEPCCPF